MGVSGVLDQLTHVVNNDGGLTLNGWRALGKTTDEEWIHDGECGGLDGGDEGGRGQLVNAFGCLLGVLDTADEEGDGLCQIRVSDDVETGGCGLGRLFLDLDFEGSKFFQILSAHWTTGSICDVNERRVLSCAVFLYLCSLCLSVSASFLMMLIAHPSYDCRSPCL